MSAMNKNYIAGLALAGASALGGLIYASESLMSFLSVWEGEKQYTVYADNLAGGLPTVCRGLTRHVTDTPIIVNEVWPESKCHAEETKALVTIQGRLINCFVIEPPQSVFDSASSHAWNVGVTSTCSSNAMQAWRKGDWVTGCERLARAADGRRVWSFVRTGRYISGKPEFKFVQGLANRRDAEVKMCLKDVTNG